MVNNNMFKVRYLRRRKLLPRRLEDAVKGLGGGDGEDENGENAPNASKANYRPPTSPQVRTVVMREWMST